jgi:hypothetical protein
LPLVKPQPLVGFSFYACGLLSFFICTFLTLFKSKLMHGKEKLHQILPSNLTFPSKPLTLKSQDVVGHNQMLTIQF